MGVESPPSTSALGVLATQGGIRKNGPRIRRIGRIRTDLNQPGRGAVHGGNFGTLIHTDPDGSTRIERQAVAVGLPREFRVPRSSVAIASDGGPRLKADS